MAEQPRPRRRRRDLLRQQRPHGRRSLIRSPPCATTPAPASRTARHLLPRPTAGVRRLDRRVDLLDARPARRTSRCCPRRTSPRPAAPHGGLRRDPRPRLLLGHPADPDHPVDLHLVRYVDDDHRVEAVGLPGLGQQGDVVDDHRAALRCGRLDLGRPGPDPRMDDRLQRLAALGVGEHQGAQLGPVQGAFRGEYVGAELLTTAASPAVPGATTSRASTSESITTAPSSVRIAETVLLPEATPPVRPTRVTGPPGSAGSSSSVVRSPSLSTARKRSDCSRLTRSTAASSVSAADVGRTSVARRSSGSGARSTRPRASSASTTSVTEPGRDVQVLGQGGRPDGAVLHHDAQRPGLQRGVTSASSNAEANSRRNRRAVPNSRSPVVSLTPSA